MMKQFHDDGTQDDYNDLWNSVYRLAAFGFDDMKALFEKMIKYEFLKSKEEKKMGIEFKTVNEYEGDMAIKLILGDCACNHGNDAKALWKEFSDYMGFKIKE